jgi:hypothetical protein
MEMACVQTKGVAADTHRIRLTALLSFGAFAVALLVSGMAHATATVFNSVTVSAGVNSPDANVSDYGNGPVSADLTSNFGSSTFTGSAQSTSSYGSIKSSVSVSITDYDPESYVTTGTNCGIYTYCGAGSDGNTILGIVDPVSAYSSIQDTLTISDASKTGQTGYIDLMFAVTGTSTLNNTSNLDYNGPGAQGTLTVYRDAQFINSWGFTGDTSVTSNLFSFTYGTPFTLRLDGDFFVDPLDALSPTLTTGDTWSLDGTVDFAHTISLAQLTVFQDSGGTQQAGGFTLEAESGTGYTVSSVPVPAAIWLFGSGLAAFAGLFGIRRSA